MEVEEHWVTEGAWEWFHWGMVINWNDPATWVGAGDYRNTVNRYLYIPKGMDAYTALGLAESYALLTNQVIHLMVWDDVSDGPYRCNRVIAYGLGSEKRRIEHDLIELLFERRRVHQPKRSWDLETR